MAHEEVNHHQQHFFLILIAFSSKTKFVTSIYGTVVPDAGKFSIAVSVGGNYKIVVTAIKPYKDTVIKNVRVEKGKSTNASTINLSKE